MSTWERRRFVFDLLAGARGRYSAGKRRGMTFRPKLEILESRTLLSGGELDLTFGTGGKVTTAFYGALPSEGKAAALQADGKVVLVGGFDNGTSSGFAVARYKADGNLDASFGNGGKITTVPDDNPRFSESADSVVIQGDGRILVAGGRFGFTLVRYNADGSLDASFGDSGKLSNHLAIVAPKLALQSDGRIIVVGSSNPDIGPHFFLARYNSNGNLDTSFGDGGSVRNPFGTANAVALQSDGKIIVAGGSPYVPGSGSTFVVARYNGNGSVDASFGNGGTVSTRFGSRTGDRAMAVVLQPDGKIVVGGPSTDNTVTGRSDYALARYNVDGSLDPSFGSGGKVMQVVAGTLTTLALQRDGSIVAAGQDTGFVMARFTPNGALDPAFGMQGRVTFRDGGKGSVLVQADGRIVAAGTTDRFYYPDYRFGVSRFTTTGSPDTSFGTGGTVTTAFQGPVSTIVNAVLLQRDGKIVIEGDSSLIRDSRKPAVLARYNPDGSLDATFGSGGRLTTTSSGYHVAGAVLHRASAHFG